MNRRWLGLVADYLEHDQRLRLSFVVTEVAAPYLRSITPR